MGLHYLTWATCCLHAVRLFAAHLFACLFMELRKAGPEAGSTVARLCWDNGKEKGNCCNGLYRDYIRIIYGLCRG